MLTPDHKEPDEQVSEKISKENINAEEIKVIKNDLNHIESFMTETTRANDFNEENINNLIREIASIKRTLTTVINDLANIKDLITKNQAFIGAKELLTLHKSSSSKVNDDPENSSVDPNPDTDLETEVEVETAMSKLSARI